MKLEETIKQTSKNRVTNHPLFLITAYDIPILVSHSNPLLVSEQTVIQESNLDVKRTIYI